MAKEKSEFMTTQAVADLKGVTRGCVMHWITAKELPATKFGNVWMIKREDAEAYTRKPIPGRPKKS